MSALTSAAPSQPAGELTPAPLRASRCSVCEVSVFPPSPLGCRLCGGSTTSVELPRSGAIETWTRPAGGDQVAEVRLDSGMLVLGRIRGAAVEVGDRVVFAGAEDGVTFERG